MKKGSVAVLSALLGAVAGAVGSGYAGQKKVDQKRKRWISLKAIIICSISGSY